MRNSKLWVGLLSLSIFLSACAMAPNTMESSVEKAGSSDMMGLPAEAPRMEMEEEAFYAEEAAMDSELSTEGAAGGERIVIKNADLSIIVTDPAAAMETIGEMAEGMDGFIVYSNLYKTTTSQGLEVPNANITVRVPAEKLEDAMAQIKALVEDAEVDIINENISGEDVTSQVTDLESRLRNLEAAETQLQEIMEDADETEDVIAVYRELTNVRGEIEVIEGQIQYYRESARLSAISVYLQAKAAVEPITIGGWQPGVEAQRAIQALVNGGRAIVDVLIWLVLFAVPMLAIIFLPIFLIVRAIRKRKAKKAAEKAPEEK
jgi:hypothetical protein